MDKVYCEEMGVQFLMKDRRYYKRLIVNIPCILYAGNKEINGVIKNLSDSGVFIECDLDKLNAECGTAFELSTIVEYVYINEEREKYINLYGEVIRTDYNGVGCTIAPTRDWLSLVDDLKVNDFCCTKMVSTLMSKINTY